VLGIRPEAVYAPGPGAPAGEVSRFTDRLPPHMHAVAGERLRLGVDLARLHGFDPETGTALRVLSSRVAHHGKEPADD
jgi:hypothetical protein